MLHRMMMICRRPLPLISYILYRYASGTPMISVMMVDSDGHLEEEFHRVIKVIGYAKEPSGNTSIRGKRRQVVTTDWRLAG